MVSELLGQKEYKGALSKEITNQKSKKDTATALLNVLQMQKVRMIFEKVQICTEKKRFSTNITEVCYEHFLKR